jgi:flagellar protein FlaI
LTNRTVEELHENLDMDFGKLTDKTEIYEYLNKKIDGIWSKIGVTPSIEYGLKMKYYVFRQTIGLDKIDALMMDPNIEDISCDGVGLPIFIFHRNPLYGEMATNIKFEVKEELDSFCMKLAQKANRSISVANPLMDGSLEDGSRIQITYGTDIARRGSNFTIRKFFKTPLSPVDLMKFGTVDAITLAYLWFAIEREKSILIAGSTATGKTTFLNAVSLFIRPNDKIVSIEDTAELQLPHTNWLPQVTRAGFGPSKYGEIDMHQLLKSSMRQRPDYLIVGEVRGVEAEVLFQAMATGHPGLSTIHADSTAAVIDRLSTPPIELPLSVLQNLDLIIFLEKIKREGKFFRKLAKIVEIEGFDAKNKELKVNDAIIWNPATDDFEKHESFILSKISETHAKDASTILEEVMRRANILKWMSESEITRFDEVSKIIKMYYVHPNAVFDLMKK